MALRARARFWGFLSAFGGPNAGLQGLGLGEFKASAPPGGCSGGTGNILG